MHLFAFAVLLYLYLYEFAVLLYLYLYVAGVFGDDGSTLLPPPALIGPPRPVHPHLPPPQRPPHCTHWHGRYLIYGPLQSQFTSCFHC